MDESSIEKRHSNSAAIASANEKPEIPKIARASTARKTISRQNWKNLHFKDFNALETEFQNCDFRYSIFERAYFRKAKFIECNFEGTQFFDCNLKSSNFYNCDLKYARFKKTLVELDDLIASLPAEPNIRQESIRLSGIFRRYFVISKSNDGNTIPALFERKQRSIRSWPTLCLLEKYSDVRLMGVLQEA